MNSISIEQYHYHCWANTKVLAHLKSLPADLYKKQIQSVFPSLFDVLAHLYVIDSGWLTILSDEHYVPSRESVQKVIDETSGKNLQEIEILFLNLSEKFNLFLKNKDMKSTSSVYAPLILTYADIVQHVMNHGTYHRGNIGAMLHQLGYAGTETDYSLYLYEKILNPKI